jgi:hypothetical protein
MLGLDVIGGLILLTIPLVVWTGTDDIFVYEYSEYNTHAINPG